MQNLLNKFEGKTFKYCGQLYIVAGTKIVNYKAVIKTDRQSFVKDAIELESFLGDIVFVDENQVKPTNTLMSVMKEMKSEKPVEEIISTAEVLSDKELNSSEEMFSPSSALQTEIVQAESNATKVSNKLMEVFNSLADNPTEETYKKAQAMVNVSNSIVNVQMAQIKFLMLKK